MVKTDPDEVFAESREVARKMSDAYWEMARTLVRMSETGKWRERYVTFDEYVIVELKMFPGQARELMRVLKKLEALEVDPQTAEDVGYVKLRTVSAKLQPENFEAIIKDLETGNVQEIRQKYCPRKVTSRLRQTPCGPQEPNCSDRENRAECGIEPLPVHPDVVKAAVVKLENGVRTETVTLKRKPGVLEWTDSAGRKHPTGLLLDVTDTVSDAILVARRHWGRYDDQHCVDGICAIFVSSMGTPEEKERVLNRLQEEYDKKGRRVWEFNSESDDLEPLEEEVTWTDPPEANAPRSAKELQAMLDALGTGGPNDPALRVREVMRMAKERAFGSGPGAHRWG